MESPKTLQQAIQYFSDEQVCIDAVAAMRWLDGPRCPDCVGDAAKRPYYLKTQKRWKCRSCRRQFSVKVNTIFEDSPIPLQKWLPALWLLISCKNGVSSWEIHRTLGVSQKSAWFMLHRLRLALKTGNVGKLGGPDTEVETDETFIGGRKKNMHKDRALRYEQRGGAQGKTAVQGFLDRDLRQVRAKIVPNVKRETLQAEVLKEVKYGSRVYTDDAVVYNELRSRFVHEVVNKTESYVNGRVHVNGMENFWSLLKRGLSGTYIAVEPFHLERYIDEQIFRYNNRATKDNPLNDSDRFLLALSQVSNKRITYKELTGKTDEAATTTPEPF
ncbi:MAG: IS1595 family transposase [Terriglobales bacterium]